MAERATCIYCPTEFDPREGEGDHVLPRGFGDFEGAIIFRGVCRSCNNRLGAIEEELLRTAPEAVFRRLAGAAHSRRGDPVGWQAAAGVPPPKFRIQHPDRMEPLNADPQDPRQGTPWDGLTITLKDRRTFDIQWFPGMTPDALRRRLDQLGVADSDLAQSHWYTDSGNSAAIEALLAETWPNAKRTELPPTEPGTHRVQIQIECRFTVKYFQAVAKIAFHYFLARTRYGFTGHEPCFQQIRTFIMDGGDPMKFFEGRRPQFVMPVGVLPNGTALLPARWMHLMACFEGASWVVGIVCTIFGPEVPPSPHFVTLLDQPSQILTPTHRYGHAYIHGNPDFGDTRTAFVESADIGVVR